MAEKSRKRNVNGVAVGVGVLVVAAFIGNIILKQSLLVSISVASVLAVTIDFIIDRFGG